MPIDSSIALGYRPPQFESPVNQMANMMQLQNAQQSNQLNALGLQEKQRSIEDNNRLRDLYAQPDFDPSTSDGLRRLRQVSATHADAVQKAQLAAQEAKSKIGKQDAETLDHSLSQFRSFVPTVQSPEQVASYVTALYKHPTLGPLVQQFGSLESLVASNQKLFAENPKQWQVGASGMTGDKLVETLKGTRQNQNLGNVNQGSTVDYFGNVVPGSVVNSAIGQDANNAATQATARRGQDLTDTRARDFNAVQVDANNIKREELGQTKAQAKDGQLASFDTMLGTLDRLSRHPGLARSVGVTGSMPTLPGSDSANFQAELNTFQSQAFLPMVAQLKGMGALSDAEGKKLTAAVGALDPKMSETAMRASISRIMDDMNAARARVAGTTAPAAPKAAAPMKNAKGWALHTDSMGNKAYVSPDGKSYEEAR